MMASSFAPQLVVQRWVTQVLKANAAVTAAVGSSLIFPDVSPTDAIARQVTHAFAGPAGGIVAKPIGAPISLVGLLWDITGWEPRYSRQSLETTMQAIMDVLIGTETKGKRHLFVDGARSWAIDCDYVEDVVVPLDATSANIWAPVRQRYRVDLRPRGL